MHWSIDLSFFDFFVHLTKLSDIQQMKTIQIITPVSFLYLNLDCLYV